MKGLILDTSTKNTIVGILEDGALKHIMLIDSGRGLSSALFPAIAPHINHLSFIAVGIGPGSYIGVRTGATIAKGLAYSKNIPLIEFSSILVSIPKEIDQPFVFVGDAKMKEYFLIDGEVSDGKIGPLSAPKLIPQSNLELELLKNKKVLGLDPIEPHLHWVVQHVLDAYFQNQTLLPESLVLQYFR